VTDQYPTPHHLVDVGTGNARDARWFAEHQGRRVTALDYSLGVLSRTARKAAVADLPIDFVALNLYDSREVLALGTRLSREAGPVDIYARFMLHALEEQGRENLLRLASMSLRQGGHLFLEFRTPEDAQRQHHFRDKALAPREYVDATTVAAMIQAHGGHVVEAHSGTGLARFRKEDPHVCRMVAAWSR
jgi:hypothetical protein